MVSLHGVLFAKAFEDVFLGLYWHDLLPILLHWRCLISRCLLGRALVTQFAISATERARAAGVTGDVRQVTQ